MTTSFASQMASQDFRRSVVTALSRKGIRLVGSQMVPDAKGSYALGEIAYTLDDNGTGRVRTYSEVLALAQG